MSTFIHSTAEVSDKSTIGLNSKIWNLTQVREGVSIGSDCILSKNVYIDFDVAIGNNCKIQNNCSIYHGAIIEDGVFLGPHVVLTNDKLPRAINPDGSIKNATDWTAGKTVIKYGASIGAHSVVLPNVTIGRFAMIGAGSVVTKDVPDFALVYGNPARIVGYVNEEGVIINKI
ncbi:MAG: acyltransferase [bacterium]